MSEQFLTTDEVAYILNISVQTLIKLIKQKKVYAIRIGHSYRIPYESIELLKRKASLQ